MKWSQEEERLLALLAQTNSYNEIAEEFSRRHDQGFRGFDVKRSSEAIRKKYNRDKANGVDYSQISLENENVEKRPRTHLIIGDSHAKPDQDLRRYEWLARMALDLRPDVIVNMGDWADMPSLSSYDRGRRSFEGRRYKRDIEAANNALETFDSVIKEFNSNADEEDHYDPYLVALLGNHENRINVATDSDSHLEGVISTDDIKFAQYGWEVYPFLVPALIDGISYSHYFLTGVSGRPISGERQAAAMIRKLHVSAVAGHSHLFDYDEKADPHGNRLFGLVSGCYFEHDESYATQANRIWWRGICVLHNVVDGYGDLQKFRMETIKHYWGD